jgi:hypothetical protein
MKRTPEVMGKVLAQFFSNTKSIDFSKYVVSDLYPLLESQIRASDENMRNDGVAAFKSLIFPHTVNELLKCVLQSIKSKPSSWFERSGLVRCLLSISQQSKQDILKQYVETVVNILVDLLLR